LGLRLLLLLLLLLLFEVGGRIRVPLFILYRLVTDRLEQVLPHHHLRVVVSAIPVRLGLHELLLHRHLHLKVLHRHLWLWLLRLSWLLRLLSIWVGGKRWMACWEAGVGRSHVDICASDLMQHEFPLTDSAVALADGRCGIQTSAK
jgi:hypothetical protein